MRTKHIKRILSVFLALLMVLPLLALFASMPAVAADSNGKPTFKFDSNGKFKILQLTD